MTSKSFARIYRILRTIVQHTSLRRMFIIDSSAISTRSWSVLQTLRLLGTHLGITITLPSLLMWFTVEERVGDAEEAAEFDGVYEPEPVDGGARRLWGTLSFRFVLKRLWAFWAMGEPLRDECVSVLMALGVVAVLEG